MKDQNFDYESFLSSRDDLVLEIGLDYTFLRTWYREESMLFMSPKDFLGKKIRQCFDASFAIGVEQLINQAVLTREIQTLEYQTPDTGTDWWRLEGIPIPHEKPESVVFTINKITQERAQKDAMARAHNILSLINRIQNDYINAVQSPDLFHRILNSLLEFNQSTGGFLAEKIPGHDNIWETLAEVGGPYDFPPVERQDVGMVTLYLRLGDRVLGALGFKGRPGGYTDGPEDLWNPLLQTLGQIIEGNRSRIQQHLAEEELKKREEIFRLVSQNSQDMICLHENDGRFIYLSPAVKSMLGFEPEELVGTTPYDLFHPDDMKRIIAKAHEKALQNEKENWVQYRMRCKDGSYIWLETLTTPILDEQGQVMKLQTSSRDISNLRKVEEEIKLLSLVARCTSNAVILTDPEGKIEWVNDSFMNITGYSLDEVRGHIPGKILQGPKTNPLTAQFMDDKFHAKEPWRCEILNYKKDGEPYWVQIDGEPIFDDQGRLMKYMAVESDVTYRKNAETQLRQAKRTAEAANKAKGQFLATMSHEIRTPMNGIMGMIDLIAGEHPSQTILEYLGLMRSSAVGLMDLLNDILDFSKIEAGRLELEAVSIDLKDLVHRVSALWEPKCREKGLEFICRYDEKIPFKIKGDPLRLSQILNNLLSNGLKFTAQGQLELSVNLFQSPIHKTELFFTVSDTGIGIPEEKQDFIFHSFTQGDNSTSREYGGTGLGLAITRNLVELMKGSISVVSKPGKGSSFHVKIPLIDPPKEADAPELALPKEPSFKGQILVAEDNSLNILIIKKLLESLGLKVTVAHDGETAVELALSGTWSLIFMDIHMPGMDGLQATREIRKRAQRQCPIIALTADAMKGDKEKCLEAGMDDYIPKPFKKSDLLTCLSKFFKIKK